jgi:hypothetical protein
LSHATTFVTNALLEKQGARAGFVTTSGFRDLLELRRSSRADLYDLFQDAPAGLVPRRWRFEVRERIDAQGETRSLSPSFRPCRTRSPAWRWRLAGGRTASVVLRSLFSRAPHGGADTLSCPRRLLKHQVRKTDRRPSTP